MPFLGKENFENLREPFDNDVKYDITSLLNKYFFLILYRYINLSWRPKVDVRDILKLFEIQASN